jgi:hypothetical protein
MLVLNLIIHVHVVNFLIVYNQISESSQLFLPILTPQLPNIVSDHLPPKKHLFSLVAGNILLTSLENEVFTVSINELLVMTEVLGQFI